MIMESIPTKVQAEEIAGLRELIAQVVLQEWDKVVPVSLLQDVEEIRRSPAGVIIRIEGAVERLESDVAGLQRTVSTKKDLAHLEEVMGARFDGLEPRFRELESRFDGLEPRFRELDTRFDGLEPHFRELESRFDGLEPRFRELDTRFDEMGKRVDTRFDEMEKRINVLRLAFFAFLALQLAILVKLFF